MAQVLIRDLDDGTLKRLKKRAADNHRSLQGELRAIVTQIVEPEKFSAATLKSLKARSPHARNGDSAALGRKARDGVTPGGGATRRKSAVPADSVWRWLKRRPPGILSKEEIDEYIRAERDSWDCA